MTRRPIGWPAQQRHCKVITELPEGLRGRGSGLQGPRLQGAPPPPTPSHVVRGREQAQGSW